MVMLSSTTRRHEITMFKMTAHDCFNTLIECTSRIYTWSFSEPWKVIVQSTILLLFSADFCLPFLWLEDLSPD